MIFNLFKVSFSIVVWVLFHPMLQMLSPSFFLHYPMYTIVKIKEKALSAIAKLMVHFNN